MGRRFCVPIEPHLAAGRVDAVRPSVPPASGDRSLELGQKLDWPPALSMRIAARVVAIPSCEPLRERRCVTDSEGRT